MKPTARATRPGADRQAARLGDQADQRRSCQKSAIARGRDRGDADPWRQLGQAAGGAEHDGPDVGEPEPHAGEADHRRGRMAGKQRHAEACPDQVRA